MNLIYVFFSVLPFPLLSRERNRNGEEKGTSFYFGTEDVPAQWSGERQMLFVWVSFDPSWVICVVPVEEGSSWKALGESKQPKIKRMGI